MKFSSSVRINEGFVPSRAQAVVIMKKASSLIKLHITGAAALTLLLLYISFHLSPASQAGPPLLQASERYLLGGRIGALLSRTASPLSVFSGPSWLEALVLGKSIVTSSSNNPATPSDFVKQPCVGSWCRCCHDHFAANDQQGSVLIYPS